MDCRKAIRTLDDQIDKLEAEAALLCHSLVPQRMALVLLAGDEWPAALALRRRQRATTHSAMMTLRG